MISNASIFRRRLYRSAASVSLILASLFLTAPASADITFQGDWTDFGSQFQTARNTTFDNGLLVGWLAGSSANQWKFIQERELTSMQSQIDPTSPKGGSVLQVTVQPGDSVGYSGERAEVSVMLGKNGKVLPIVAGAAHDVYGLSVKLDPNWIAPTRHGVCWGLFMQLHSPNQFGFSPAFAMAAESDFHAQTLGGDIYSAAGQLKPAANVPFSNGSLSAGHWVQFMIDAVWAFDNTGSLAVYRRDEGQKNFVQVMTQTGIPTLQYDSQINDSQSSAYAHYWKSGFYRCDVANVTNRLWLGPIVRGGSLSEVAAAVFSGGVIPKAPTELQLH